jgi:hypothetical protein
MLRTHKTCQSRALSRLSHYLIHGPNIKERPENQIHILNLSDYDLKVYMMENDEVVDSWLIYPLVIGYCARPREDQYFVLENNNNTAMITPDRFKKKMNTFIGSIDLKNLKIPSSNRLWINEVLSKSDTIRIVADDHCIVEHRTPSSWSITYPIIFVSFLLLICFICIIVCGFAVKSLNND